jgi:hypothetical protein
MHHVPRAIDRPVSHPILGVSKRIRIRTILRNRFSAIDFRPERDLLDVFLPLWPYLNRYARHFAFKKFSDPAHVDASSENPVFSHVSPTLGDDSRAALLTGSTFAQSRDNNRHRRSA